MRFEHFFEKDEDKDLSKPVSVTLTDMFVDFKIISLVEMNLSANQYLKDKKVHAFFIRNDKTASSTRSFLIFTPFLVPKIS